MLAIAAYITVREDASTGLTYKFTFRSKLYKKFN
ncbi:MAG: palindromic element RPE1 domain-containing protein [Rickettsia endosymbiont of Eriopis connexa]|nr:palindromic element RPE1 domain-containing protein [Rickettsia endosymbiont of Eriopis connexa]